jgi:hypothetical protein
VRVGFTLGARLAWLWLDRDAFGAALAVGQLQLHHKVRSSVRRYVRRNHERTMDVMLRFDRHSRGTEIILKVFSKAK